MRRLRTLLGSLFFLATVAPLHAAELAKADLQIVGVSLQVDTTSPVTTGIDIPAIVQTIFGGKTNELAPPANGMSAMAELTGPGIDTPITVSTVPGHQFILPPLHQTGEYSLQNIRLAGADGSFLQQATPAFVPVTVSDVLQSSVTVHQLTADELRQRGITIDGRNYDVYEYTLLFGVKDQFVQVPYVMAIDRRTHETVQIPKGDPYELPQPKQPGPPPRFQPPTVGAFALEPLDFTDPPPPPGTPPDTDRSKRKPTIPAAIVLPTGFGVLHQFFAVILDVTNNAPQGSTIQLDSITATLDSPLAMRIAKTNPSVPLGAAVPVHDKTTGATFLIAQGEGTADWSLEALKAGTHTVNVTVHATYKNPPQADVSLTGKLATTIVVSDPRFQINFVHPDVIRAGEKYTAYAFITNTSAQAQNVRLDTSDIPSCGSGYSGNNVCRTEGDGVTNLTLQPGEMKPVPYKLTSKITGKIFAAAANADSNLTVTVQLTMGVSSSGIPLSPATLLLPRYAQYVNQDYVNAQLGILGLGYSLATAPLQRIVNFPRVIQSDVFLRAQDIARAGERIFVARKDPNTDDPAEDRDPIFQLALDQLSNAERVDQIANTPDLKEWDQLRRQEEDGHASIAALARELERVGLAGGKNASQFVDDFAAATSHRAPYVLALVHGATVSGNSRPYAVTLNGITSKTQLAVPNEAASGWVRTLPFAELDSFSLSGEYGELALVGRWSESLELQVVSANPQFTVELIYPGVTDGSFMRSSFVVSNVAPATPAKITIDRGANILNVTGGVASASGAAISQTPLRVVAAAQDLYLDSAGHTVSVLFNRPINAGDASLLRNLFSLTTTVAAANYHVTRKNNPSDPNAPLFVPGAAITGDGRMVNVTFDKTLSTNAQYTMAIDPITDRLVPTMTFTTTSLVPRIDNNAPGGIVYGKVLRGDNTEIPQVLVQLDSGLPPDDGTPRPAASGTQFDTSTDHGDFLFEYIPRDIDRGANGGYTLSVTAEGKFATVNGAVRLPGEAQHVNIVFLGRGSVKGRVTYSDGTAAKNVPVTIANTHYNTNVQEFRRGVTDSTGNYNINDVPVGPLTIAAQDTDGNVVYAANQIRVVGEQLTQDLVFQKRELSGVATVRVTVRRSDVSDPAKSIVPNAHVGVYTQGYGLVDGFTDANGQFTFTNIPAGFISILAAEFSITNESAGIELDLKPDTSIDQVIILHVPTPAEQAAMVTLQGSVWRDDPAAPSDTGRDVIVKGAIVTVRNHAPVTTDDQGNFTYGGISTALSDQRVIDVFDPETGRRGTFNMPTLQAGTNQVKLRLSTTVPQGFATLRVRLVDAQGTPVTGYRVIEPGFPEFDYTEQGNGIYIMEHVPVPVSKEAWAIGIHHPRYGDQVAHGNVGAIFDGQISTLELRLPGQGTILGKMEIRKPCPQPPAPCTEEWDPAFGTMGVTYPVWNDDEQEMESRERVLQADPITGVTTIDKVPVGDNVPVYTIDHPAGFAQSSVQFAYDGEVRTITLRLSSLGDVTGRVLSFDGQTPVAGASVQLVNGTASFAPAITGPDGSFKFSGVAANIGFRIIAETTQDGVYRTGYVDGRTPTGGGPVGGLVVIMRQQARIEGTIVDTSGAPIPLGQYWVREFNFPNRSFGSQEFPLNADKNGHFVLTNVFAGPFRVSAKSPANQELRGDAQGSIGFENDNQTNIVVTVGGAGTGSISVTVVDSNNAFARVPNAEVSLIRGSVFDFATTDANGNAFFDQVPVGSYSVFASAKALARTGSSDPFSVVANGITPVQVTLTFLGKVTGTLTDPENNPPTPVIGTPVTLVGGGGYLQTQASTDGAGAFQFIGVPEGTFTLRAVDIDSGRVAQSTGDNFISKLFPERSVALQLQRLGIANIKAYLPDDAGNAGVLAPLVDVKVTQGTHYSREAQGNDLNFPKLFLNERYNVTVKEMGGEERVVQTSGTFAANSLTSNVAVVFPTSGSVQVKVTADDPSLIQGAQVQINGGKSATLFCDSTGIVSASGFSLGNITVYVTSANLSATATGVLASHSTPLVIEVKLGSRATITGFVEAEDGVGQPSIGTRVSVDVSSAVSAPLHLDTRTDSTGHWSFTGIPVSNTNVSIKAYGPDDVTQGATASAHIPDGSTGTVQMPSVKLDATPPRVLSIDPANNSNAVSPNAQIVVAFSEPIGDAFLTPGNFQLMATDDSSLVTCVINAEVVNGVYRVRMTPVSLLKSNVVYALTVSSGIQDRTGNHLKAPVGSIFTTVNYTEPKIITVTPPVELPLPEQSTFRMKFNKAIAMSSFDAGNGGSVVLQQLDTYKGNPIATIPTILSLDTTDPSTLIVAPTGVAIQPSSFYRMTVSGVRDTQTPFNTQKDPQVFDWFSFDQIKPVVTIHSPLPDGFPLISGVHYTATVTINDENTTNVSKDIAWVDWFDSDGTTDTFRARVKAAPFSYDFTAPAGTSYTLKASATDLSGNTGPLATFTFTVKANEAPKNVHVTNTPSAVFLNGSIASEVSFDDEGLVATVGLAVTAKHTDGSAYPLPSTSIHPSVNQQVSRARVDASWPTAKFTVDVPNDAQEGQPLVVTATVTDSVNQSTSASSNVDLTLDATNPTIVSMTPAPETHFKFNDTFSITVNATDLESGIKHLTLAWDNQTADMKLGDAGVSYNATTKTYTFTKSGIKVPAKNNDTRIHIVATAYDYHGNLATQTNDVVYEGVNDVTIPKASWISPLDGAALPAGDSAFSAKLRIKATDDFPSSLKVVFSSPVIANSPVTATRVSGTADVFEAPVTLNMPAAGNAITLTATVSDDNPDHDVVLPISIDAVAVDQTIPDKLSITASVASQYSGKTIVVKGASALLYVTTPLTLKNLIVLDGGKVSNPDRTKLDLTITDHVYVDTFSAIDLTSKGYLGAWQRSEDLTFTNSASTGMTAGNTATNGAHGSASHGGLGSNDDAVSHTNLTYDSITNPSDFGAGGGGSPACCIVGANGGGAASLNGANARVVIAGGVIADGGLGLCGSPCIWGAGAGGSIVLNARQLITGPATRITANGGDDNAFNNVAAGAGGGRVAIRVTDRLDLDPTAPVIQARGGRNGTNQEGATYTDGGAGTVFLVRPGDTNGELTVSAFDERWSATSTHLARGTPLAGTLTFDSITIGPRALARFDNDYTVPSPSAFTADATAMVLTPADLPTLTFTTQPAADATVPQGSNIVVTYTANAKDGIGYVRLPLSAAASETIDFTGTYPASITNKQTTLTVANTATLGAATLSLATETRSGRTLTTPVTNFTIATNTSPTIDQFDVAPSSLQIYAGHDITVNAAATDDVAVTALTLTASTGTLTSSTFASAPHVTRNFTVSIPPTATTGANVTLTLSASDGFSGHAATTQTKSVAILHDGNPPAVTMTSPPSGTSYDVSSLVTIPIRATVVDAEVGVTSVWATIDGGAPITMSPDTTVTNGWKVDAPVPPVDGTQPVSKNIVVFAKDYENNTGQSAALPVTIKPVFDPNGPIVTWVCPTSNALVPAGATVKVRISAIPASPDNGVSAVNFYVGSSQTPVVGTSIGSNLYEATITMPSVADGTTVPIQTVVTSIRNNSAQVFVTVTAVTGTTITTATTISATDTSKDNQTLIINGATVTIGGHHNFTRLVVMNAGKLLHAQTTSTSIERVDVSASAIYVSCDSSIDVSARGFDGTVGQTAFTYRDATSGTLTGGSFNGAGGSHGGTGGKDNSASTVAKAYGSLFDPNEPGGAGANWSACTNCGTGGGIVRLAATGNVVIDGSVLANGTNTNSVAGGAGGSVRIDAVTVSGSGQIHADGGTSGNAAGGGGRIALYYQSLSFDKTKIGAPGGSNNSGASRTGSAGTVYLRQNDSSSQKLSDELIVDNASRIADRDTDVPFIASGTVTAVNGATLTLSASVPDFIDGTTIELLDSSGNVTSITDIVSHTATTVTLRTAPSVTTGTAYRNSWRFGKVTVTGNASLTSDSLRAAAITTNTSAFLNFNALRADALTLNGWVKTRVVTDVPQLTIDAGGKLEVDGTIKSTNLSVIHGGTITQIPTSTTAITRVNIQTTSLTVDATSSIDVSARGLDGTVGQTGYTYANNAATLTGGAVNGTGGSHGGLGGKDNGGSVNGVVYGSLFDPNEPGAAGGNINTCTNCGTGGGIIRINASTAQIDGNVLANGTSLNSFAGGAGGSIRLDVGTLSGAGQIRAEGGASGNAAGGGGRVAVYYQTLTFDKTKIGAAGGSNCCPTVRLGTAGTVYLRQVNASAQKVSDELVIDNAGRNATDRDTTLPTIGNGTVTAVNGAVVTLSGAVPSYIDGQWIEFLDATGAVASSYEIASHTATTVTVILGANESAANVAVNGAYRGAWRFDKVTVSGNATLTSDTLRTPSIITSGSGYLTFSAIRADALTLKGWVKVKGTVDVPQLTVDAGGKIEADGTIKSTTLSVVNGGTLTQIPTTINAIARLNIQATTLNVDANSTIDVSARGFDGSNGSNGITYKDANSGTTTGAASASGGSHGGIGSHDGGGTGNALAYGSLYDPNEPGGSGGYGSCTSCETGGGVVRVTATTLQLDGKILANGLNNGGAGGSIRIDTGTLSGAGQIHADGGGNSNTAGGGGRVAIYYQTLTLNRANITASGGPNCCGPAFQGAAGTIFLKSSAQTLGDLLVKNGTVTNQATPLNAVGFHTVSSFTPNSVTDSAAAFPTSNGLAGINLILNNDATKWWPILSNDTKSITVTPDANFTPANGNPFRGLYRFDSLTLTNANFESFDLVQLGTPVIKDSASNYWPGNVAAPVVNASMIRIDTTAIGPTIIGSSTAVTDSDQPVVVTVTNKRTGATFVVNAASDGSFVAPIAGLTGDTITLKAKDSNHFPLESAEITLGQLTTGSPTVSQVNRSTYTSDGNFRIRQLALEGATLIASAHPIGGNPGMSDKLVRLDVSVPSSPQYVDTTVINNNFIEDIALLNGYAYVASDDLRIVNMNVKPSVMIFPDRGTDNYTLSVLPTNGYVFVGTDPSVGRIQIFDNTNPNAPRFVRNQDLGGSMNFTKLIALGSRYIIAINPNGTNDVNIIDRSDINNLVLVKQLAIPQMSATQARLAGNLLYVVDDIAPSTGVAIVDVSNPLNPILKTFVATNGGASGVDALANDVFVANGTAGVAVVNASDPANATLAGSIAITGNARDVVMQGEYAYVASEDTLSVFAAGTSPKITPSLVTLTRDSATNARVTGARASVTGHAPLTIAITNQTTNATVSGVSVAGDGSFSATIPAVSGDVIAITATDGSSHTTSALVLGAVPFGSAVTTSVISPSTTGVDGTFRARIMEVEGNNLIVASWFGANSDKVVHYDISNPLAPRFVDTTVGNNNFITDIAIKNGYAYVAEDDLRVINLNVTPAQLIIPDRGTDNYTIAVAVDGTYCFVATDPLVGRIQLFDVTNPNAPRWLRNQDLGGGANFQKLIPLGSSYLIAVTPQGSNDVWIIDRRDVNNLKTVAQLQIPQLFGNGARLVGNTLYVTQRGTGLVAIVDVSNPLAPSLKNVITTPGASLGFDGAGTTLAVGDGGVGVSFIDVSNVASPKIIGSQPTPGSAWDVRYANGALFVAHETGISVIPDVTSPPAINTSLINVSRTTGGGIVAGTTGAIGGQGSLTVSITNRNTGANVSGIPVNANGTFSGMVTGASGDGISVSATDGFGRTTGPIAIGSIPFGASSTTSQISIGIAKNDSGFKARLMEIEGKNLVVTGWAGSAASDKVVRFDLSNPLAPAFVDTTAGNNNLIYDLALKNGYAYVAEDDLRVINMNVTPSQLIIPDRGTDNYTLSVAVDGTYCFVGTDPSVGRIQIFDISNPQAPHWLRNQDLGGGVNFWKLVPYGTSYLFGITNGGSNDLWVIDRRDVNNLKVAAQIPISGMTASTARLVGNTLYVSDRGAGAVAVVDVTNPTAPVVKSVTTTNGGANGFDAAGATLAVGDGSAGVSMYNVSNPASPQLIGIQATPGNAWDTRFANGALYVAHETGITVIADVASPPAVYASLIQVTRDVSGGVVTGAKGSITGQGTLTVAITNRNTGATASGVAVASDGSFTSTITGSPGDSISVTATDGNNRTTGPIVVGSIPYGASVTTTPITIGMVNNDSAFRAHVMEIEGNNLVVTSWEGGRSDKILRFDLTDALHPHFVDTVAGNNNFIWDVALKNGYAYVAEDDLRVVNMNVTPSQIIVPDRGTDNYTISVAVDSTYCFVGTDPLVGRIQVFDISNPQAPRWLRNQDLGGGVNFHKLIPIGVNYLAAVTPQGTNDLWIIDRRDVNNLRVVAQVPVSGMNANNGRLVGNTLYLTERGGTSIAVIDITNPAAPVVKSIAATSGGAFDVDAAGSMIAVGDGSVGVTMLNAANPSSPVITGVQSLPGNAWDVRFANGALYVVHETGLSVVTDISAPPVVTTGRISVTRSASGGVITGLTRSVAGQGTLTVSITDSVTTSTTSGIAVNADGSFSTTIATALPGHDLTIQATDSAGRASAIYSIGQVPFGSSVASVRITPAQVDSPYRARLMVIEGNILAVTSWSNGQASDRIVRFDITDPANPHYVDTTAGNNNYIWDVAIKNGYVYTAEDDVRVINMNVTPSAIIIPDRGTDNYTVSVAVSGNNLFVGTDPQVGRIQIFDITNQSAAPHWLRSQDMGGGANFHKLVPIGTNYLAAITPQGSNDVSIIDKSNINNLVTVAQLQIPAFNGTDAKLIGNLLYVTERGRGTGVAIVDVTNPLAPVLKSTTNTRGYTFGLEPIGTFVAVGDGTPGLTILDTSDPAAPKVLGTQFVGGNVWDAVYQNNTLWCATEVGIAAVQSFSVNSMAVAPTASTASTQHP